MTETTSPFFFATTLADNSSLPLTNSQVICPRFMESSPGELITTVIGGVGMLVIITSAIVGNTLVIVGVLKYEKLRIVSNIFILSMAIADLLIALCVMPLNAGQELCGQWLLGKVCVLILFQVVVQVVFEVAFVVVIIVVVSVVVLVRQWLLSRRLGSDCVGNGLVIVVQVA